MGSGANDSSTFSFVFIQEKDIHTTIVVVIMLLLWGIGYMNIIKKRLFFFFNETVFNSLVGATLGFAFGSSKPLRQMVDFFVNWNIFVDKILPFMILYPASKLCLDTTRKHLRMTLTYSLISGLLCVAFDSCAMIGFLSTRPLGFFLNGSTINTHKIMFAIYLSASVSIYDSYLCVHNFPEIRGNSFVRGFMSSHGLFAMSLALELRHVALDVTSATERLPFAKTAELVCFSLFFVPPWSILLGVTFGLVSSYITKHSSFMLVEQEMVVMPCINYIAYIVAHKYGLSPTITSISCEVIQSSYSIHNISEGSKVTYKALLANSSKLLGFLCTVSMGFHFATPEIQLQWKYVNFSMLAVALFITVVVRIFSSLLGFWCVRRLGFPMRSNLMFLSILIHTRATPSLMSIINLHQYADRFKICQDKLLVFQWTGFVMLNLVNLINVPLVGLLYKRLKIEPDIVDNQTEPIFHVIFRLMYQEMDHQIMHLSGERSISQLFSHVKKSFVRNVMSLGFMSVPERKSPIVSAYDRTISQRANVIDERRKSLRSKKGIHATQVCASFLVRNLGFEGFHADDIVEYFLAA